MTAPYYADEQVTLYHGDCLDVLAELPDSSVDSVVTDPPYNLSFMAKPWDAYEGYEDAGFAYWLTGLIDGEGHFAIKAHSRGTHAPGFSLKMRADELCTLELIKRTMGIGSITHEDHQPNPTARWNVQDKAGCQRLVDLLDKYPLRAKKRIDYWTWREAVCEWTSRPRGNRWHGGASNDRMATLRGQIMSNRAYTSIPWSGNEFQDWCRLWATECLRVLKPGGHMLAFGGTRTWHRLACAIEDAGFEIRDSIAWLYGSGFPKSLDVSKAIDKAAGAEREQLAVAKGARNGNWQNVDYGAFRSAADGTYALTTPATDAAKQWQGWGTALKPAFEPVVVARKPLGGSVNIRARVEHELRQRGVTGVIEWKKNAASAENSSPVMSSGGTEPAAAAAPYARCASDGVTAGTASETARITENPPGDGATTIPTGQDQKDGGGTANSGNRSSTTTALLADAAASTANSSSHSTTSKAGAPHIESPSTARFTPNLDGSDSLTGTESYAGIATGLIGSMAHVLIKRNPTGSFVWPDDLPESIAGGSTVAANVLAHGTGALNVDGCRVATTDDLNGGGYSNTPNTGSFLLGGCQSRAELVSLAEAGLKTPNGENAATVLKRADRPVDNRVGTYEQPAGRWPANVLLDGSQADALDKESGTTVSKSGGVAGWQDQYVGGKYTAIDRTGYDDSGGASRFFPTFHYTAKAPGTERPTADGVSHPTVKPVELMRWLIRLVTPPNGVVLDPFAGSGTTGEAAIHEHKRAILIEREPSYLPLIVSRLSKPMAIGFDFEGIA
jgi:DNA modification methylase